MKRARRKQPVDADRVKLLEQMVRIREFDEKAGELYAAARLAGSTHLYVGMEAVAVGVCAHLRKDDYITSTHRGHGHCIAKGADMKRMFAELLGRRTGYCKGKGGSMHIADISLGHLGANGIVGGGLTIATGAALASRIRKTDQVAVCFFGDGALNIGPFHESLNLAGLWSLPVVYVCENNMYGMSTHWRKAASVDRIETRGASYAMPGVAVDGMDVDAVHAAAGEAVQRARRGDGPSFLVMNTYRYYGHSRTDPCRYRTKEEEAEWRQRDPIVVCKDRLEAEGCLTEAQFEAMRARAVRDIDEAVAFAEASPYPTREDLETDVYCEDVGRG